MTPIEIRMNAMRKQLTQAREEEDEYQVLLEKKTTYTRFWWWRFRLVALPIVITLASFVISGSTGWLLFFAWAGRIVFNGVYWALLANYLGNFDDDKSYDGHTGFWYTFNTSYNRKREPAYRTKFLARQATKRRENLAFLQKLEDDQEFREAFLQELGDVK